MLGAGFRGCLVVLARFESEEAARTSDEQLREQLAGAVLEAVPRDLAPVGGKHLE